MKTFEVRRQIAARPEVVWAILSNPQVLVAGGLGLISLEGQIAPGNKLRLVSQTAPERTFVLTVQAFETPRRMVWASGLPLVFNGTRSFTLTTAGDGTAFHMAEVCRGLMLPVIWGSLPDMQPGFELFGDGLKRLAEGG